MWGTRPSGGNQRQTVRRISFPHRSTLADGVKAWEKPIFGPCTLLRTWGTHPKMLANEMRVLTRTLYLRRQLLSQVTVDKASREEQ